MNKEQELRIQIKEMYDYWQKYDEDGHCKSQEGHISIFQYFGNVFEEQKESWGIEVYSYIFCDGRRFEYNGKTKEEVIQKAMDYFKIKFEEYKECVKLGNNESQIDKFNKRYPNYSQKSHNKKCL